MNFSALVIYIASAKRNLCRVAQIKKGTALCGSLFCARQKCLSFSLLDLQAFESLAWLQAA